MLQRLIQFSVERRWWIVLAAVIAAGIGVWSLERLPIDAVPDITDNQVQINTLVAALSPEQIERQVTLPIESALAGIPGLRHTRSLSRNGFSQVTAVFADDVDVYFARNQINERLSAARATLPPDAQPALGPITTGLGEVYMWSVEYAPRQAKTEHADGQPGWQFDGVYVTPEGARLETELEQAAYLREVEDWIIRPQLKSAPGLASIDVIGGYEKQYVVQPDVTKLAKFGLTLTDVVDALKKNNGLAGAGFIEHHGTSYPVRVGGQLKTIADIEKVVVGYRKTAPVRVSDVASVAIGAESRTGSASKGGREVVIGTAMMLIGANSRSVAAAVDERMAEVKRSLPPDIRVETVYDRTKLVAGTIHTVAENLAAGAILVIAVLFLLLGNVWAALITALAIPLSMLLTTTGMVANHISGNLMSLGAIDFGIIVDGAVIIVENCLRRLAEAQHRLGRQLTLRERLDVVLSATGQVRKATAFGEAIIITVYLPILTLGGIEGKMFRPMALTVIFALVAAMVLSVTFIPAMVAIVVRGKVRERENWLVRGASAVYGPVLSGTIRFRGAVVALAVVAVVAAALLVPRLGQEFTPTLDEQDLLVSAARITGTSLSDAQQMQFEVERIVSREPEVKLVFSKTGTAEVAADPMPPNFTDTFVILKPRAEWPNPKLPKAELVRRLDEKLKPAPGTNCTFSQPIQMRFNELLGGVRGDVAIKVYGDDFAALAEPVEQITKTLKSIAGEADIKAEEVEGLPLLAIEPNRAALERHGLSIEDVHQAVGTAIGGTEAGQILEGDRRFALVVRMADGWRSDPDKIGALPIPLPHRHEFETDGHGAGESRNGGANTSIANEVEGAPPGFVPLSSLSTCELAEGYNQISRDNGKRRIVVQCNVRGRDIGSFVGEAQRKIAELKLPAGCWLQWGGQFENMIAARNRLIIVVPACLLLIFVLLLASFHSVKDALLVFTGVPLALCGGVVAIWMRGIPLSISAAVGFIALSGVAVLNGLVMITFINQLRSEGRSLYDAVWRGSMTRLRPVLMTALVASLGFVPMAVATGPGAEVQRPLATVVIGGIVSSTLLTLLVLPALYRLWHREQRPIATSEASSLAGPPAPLGLQTAPGDRGAAALAQSVGKAASAH